MLDAALIIPAFIAGVLTFLAPCTLPLVPGYLAFISGVSLNELRDPEKARRVKRQIFLNGVFFVLGFSVVFIILGSLAGMLGRTLGIFRIWLSRIGGIFVILFGLFLLDIFKIPFLAREIKWNPPAFLNRGNPLNAFILGSAFGLGWTPCIGPILGSILILAASTVTLAKGAFLLIIFSLGLALPFLLIAATIGGATTVLQKISHHLKIISVIGGIFLIGLGLVLLTNNMALLISYGYRALEFINYDRLLEYL